MDTQDILELLNDLAEYMDQRADADGDSEGFHPNKEMSLGTRIDQAIKSLERGSK